MEFCENCGCREFTEYIYNDKGERVLIKECKDCGALTDHDL